MSKIKKIIILSFFGFASSCFAGDPGGPNIVWINLDNNDGMGINASISKIVHANQPMCWDASKSYIYTKTRPEGITNNLAKKALIQGDAAAISKLNYLLKNYSDNIVHGFDGIIVYSSIPKPRMIGLTTGRMKAEIDYIKNTQNLNKVEASFCMVMPEVVTNP